MIAYSVDAWLARTTVDCPSYARRIGRRECAMRREDRDPRCRACQEEPGPAGAGPEEEQTMQTPPTRSGRSVRACARCGQVKALRARSLCGTCHSAARRNGEMHLYPRVYAERGPAPALPDTWGDVADARVPAPPQALEDATQHPAEDAVRVRATGFRLGPLVLSYPQGLPGRLWIAHQSGEAGAFPEEEVAEVLEAYFWKRF